MKSILSKTGILVFGLLTLGGTMAQAATDYSLCDAFVKTEDTTRRAGDYFSLTDGKIVLTQDSKLTGNIISRPPLKPIYKNDGTLDHMELVYKEDFNQAQWHLDDKKKYGDKDYSGPFITTVKFFINSGLVTNVQKFHQFEKNSQPAAYWHGDGFDFYLADNGQKCVPQVERHYSSEEPAQNQGWVAGFNLEVCRQLSNYAQLNPTFLKCKNLQLNKALTNREWRAKYANPQDLNVSNIDWISSFFTEQMDATQQKTIMAQCTDPNLEKTLMELNKQTNNELRPFSLSYINDKTPIDEVRLYTVAASTFLDSNCQKDFAKQSVSWVNGSTENQSRSYTPVAQRNTAK